MQATAIASTTQKLESLSIFDDWLPPTAIAKECRKRLDAPRHSVFFAASAAHTTDIESVWRIATLLSRAYPEEWVEARWLAGLPQMRLNESSPIPLTLLVASEAPSALLEREIATTTTGGLFIWRGAGVPAWHSALILPSDDMFGWIGNQHSIEAL